jgi:hypothetical protein
LRTPGLRTTSDLGWAFIGLIDGGRIKEDVDDEADITRIYRHQLAACTDEVLPGPGKMLRWSVPANRGHDDLLISTALTARLDQFDWREWTARGSAGLCAEPDVVGSDRGSVQEDVSRGLRGVGRVIVLT